MLFDIIIRNAEIVDGTNTPAYKADVGLVGDRIVKIGELTNEKATSVIDAEGLIVSPGFIDVHTHDDTNVIRYPDCLPKISQGVTTVIVGNCGISASPAVLECTPPDPMNLLGKQEYFKYPTFAHSVAAIVIQINTVDHAIPLAKALVENGLPVAEVTFRTEATAASIKVMRDAYPELCIGAGNILNSQQVDLAIEAGAEFIVAPGLNPNTVKYCQENNITIIPGVNNPSQVEQALELGLSFLKFFPAEASGGVNMVKSLLAPYGDVAFMPTGGISKANVNDYLSLDRVHCCGGTWMVATSLIENEQWDHIGELVRAAVATTR